MNTLNYNKTTQKERDPIYNLTRELKIRGFSPKTQKTYLYYNKKLLKFTNKSPKNINTDDIKEYLLHLKNNNSANATINTVINAIKFYYTQILKRKFFVNKEIFRTKKVQKLPEVLTKQEVKQILSTIQNIQHKLLLALMYSSGLRVSEVINLKTADFDFDSKILRVRQAKGKKDRNTILAKKMTMVLKKFTKNKNADDYIFINNRSQKYTTRTVQKIFTNALAKTGNKKPVTCHSLRHSFATHLLESGTDIRYIQSLLGHARLETTQIYTKVASDKISAITNPLDTL